MERDHGPYNLFKVFQAESAINDFLRLTYLLYAALFENHLLLTQLGRL